MAATSFAFARLVHRWRATTLRATGLAVAASSSALLLAVALVSPAVGAGALPSALVWVLLSGLTAGMGVVLPAGFAPAQAAGDRSCGTASALGGGLAFTCGAVVIPLTGLVGTASVVPMATLMTAGLAVAVLAARRPEGGRRGGGEPTGAAAGGCPPPPSDALAPPCGHDGDPDADGRRRSGAGDLYRVAVEEYRFQARSTWSGTQYLLASTAATLTAAGALGDGRPAALVSGLVPSRRCSPRRRSTPSTGTTVPLATGCGRSRSAWRCPRSSE